ncbi:unnamed protein product [Sphacelaria rigidula]
MYPWALLVVLSVLIPGISFMGHFSGIVVGMLHVRGYTKPLLPSPAYLMEMETFATIRDSVALRPNFVPCPASAAVPAPTDSSSGSMREACRPICALFQSASNRVRAWRRGGGGGLSGDGDIEASGRLVQGHS